MGKVQAAPTAVSSARSHSGSNVHVGPGSTSSASTHTLQIYEDEAFFADRVAEFLSGAIAADRPAVLIATPEHRDAILLALTPWQSDPTRLLGERRIRYLDARHALSQFMEGGSPARAPFFLLIGDVFRQCIRDFGEGPIHAHGEMVDLLWREGRTQAAGELEMLWNELAETMHFHLLCTYPMSGFADASHAQGFDEICAHHGRVLPTERFDQKNAEAALRGVALLQQRALALENELRVREQLEYDLREALAQRERAQAAERLGEQEMKDCLDNAVEAIHWVGADGRILWANHAELDLLGYSADEYVGRHIAEFHADHAAIDDILKRLVDGETLRDAPSILRHSDGSLRHVLINSNVLWRDGQFIHTRCFTRDVTEARRAAEEREQLLAREHRARQDAEAANRAKGDFMAVMSHELRTPLNAIGGYVNLLELGLRGPLTAEQREYLTRIQKSQHHLLGLINDVLSYTRIEIGGMSYVVSDVPVQELLSSLEPLIRPQLDAAGLRFVMGQWGVPVVARADAERMRQVLLNLLSNAVKFTGRGGLISVECRESTDAAARPLVVVEITDTGEGIPADKLEAVFEPFVQVHTGLTRTHQGTGLGLAISRDLARGMHGDLSVSSTVGVGSVFTLTLPRG